MGEVLPGQRVGPAQQAEGLLTHSSTYFLTEQVHSPRHQALARTPLSDIRKPSWLLSSCLLPSADPTLAWLPAVLYHGTPAHTLEAPR